MRQKDQRTSEVLMAVEAGPTTRRRDRTAANGAHAGSATITNEVFRERFERMVQNISLVIQGKDEVIRLSLVALLADGHILFEDMPGTGKTMLARTIARTI